MLMINTLIEALKQIGITANSISISEYNLGLITTGEKVIFIQEVNDDINAVHDLCNQIAEAYSKNIDNFITLLNIPYETEQVERLDLKQVLWDLYIIAVKSNLEESMFDLGIKSKFERNTFIARKILIQSNEIDEIIHDIQQIVYPNRTLSEHLSGTAVLASESELVSQILGTTKSENEKVSSFNSYDEINKYLSDLKRG